jgi:hypothetical protein
MNANLLKNLDALITQDKAFSQQSYSASKVENQLANLLLDGKLTEIESKAGSIFLEMQETLATIETGRYPFRPGLAKRIPIQIKRILKKKLLVNVTQQLQDIYGLDEIFSVLAMQLSPEIKTAVASGKSLSPVSFPKDWPFHKVILAKRTVLLDLSRAWAKEETDEPILWKISTSLRTIVGCSFHAVSEAFAQICLAASAPQNTDSKDSISSFFLELNDDKAGNVLDNLVLSQSTYQTMLDEGWKPDRWEIENLPMSIGMFLDFMSKNGFNRVKNIGDIAEINLKDSIENYRYRGSPFLTSDELKKVKVIVPGWENKGELIIRPKVNEISA